MWVNLSGKERRNWRTQGTEVIRNADGLK